jgi:hypothetical protein
MNSQDLALGVTIAKDVILAVAAIIGTVVAVLGLRTWSRQLKGGVEYELTRRLLRNAYRVREAIAAVRAPFMSAAEMALPDDERAKLSREQAAHYGSVRGYEKRWEGVTSAIGDLRTDLLEAEAVWGSNVHVVFDPLLKLHRELFVTVHMYLQASDPARPESSREALHAQLEKGRDVLYGLAGSEADAFGNDVAAAIRGVEGFLKPHLRK